MPIQFPGAEVRDDVHFSNQNKKSIFERAWLNIVFKAVLNFGFWTMQHQFGGCIFGPPFRAGRHSLASCHLLAANQGVFVLFVFACLGPIFDRKISSQLRSESKLEQTWTWLPLTLDRAQLREWQPCRPIGLSNFGLPCCQIFDCFSISPLSRLLFRFLHQTWFVVAYYFHCNKIRFPEVSYFKNCFELLFAC